MKKVLILGGTGFIGSELAILFSKKNHEVHVTTQGLSYKNEINNIKLIEIVYDQESFTKILSENNYSAVFILSGNPHPSFSHKKSLLDINLLLIPLVSLLEAMRIVNFKGNVWYASSVAVYGSNSGMLNENLIPRPISPYGIAKLTGENYCKYYFNEYGLKIGILRLFSTYGPNLRRQVVYEIYTKILKNPPEINLLSKQNDSRDMSYVVDITRAMFHLNKKTIPKADIFNIGSGKEYLIIDIVKFISTALNYKGQINFASNSQSYDGDSWFANVDKLKSFGFYYKYDLYQGLEKTINEWKKNPLI